MKTSNFLSLNWADFAKGLLMAVLTPVIVVIQQSIENGTFTFDWKVIALSAIGGGLAYLTKNFFTQSKEVKSITEDETESIGQPFPKKK